MSDMISDFTPQQLREWCEALGQKTFVGTSGRVFPEAFKASPLLGAWITRLKNQGVVFKVRHEWKGWNDDGNLLFETLEGSVQVKPDATLLALGGASWPRLGTDGSWVGVLEKEKIRVAPLQPANCGFRVAWTDMFRQRFAGQALKSVVISFKDVKAPGQIMITESGIEGGGVYAVSALLRDEIEKNGPTPLFLDLKPDVSLADLEKRLKKPRGKNSLSNHLRKALDMPTIAVNVLMERPDREKLGAYDALELARLIKNCPLTLTGPSSIDRAISTAGGVAFDELDENLMLLKKPGVFIAGEMLDWEAPTGGYLLQAIFATGVRAAKGIAAFLS